MSVATVLRDGIAPIIDLVFPPRCPLCGEGMATQSGVCGQCWNELVIPGEPSCALCQRPFAGTYADEGAICAPCLQSPPGHDGIAAATLYNDASRKLILAFKHGGRIALAPMLARLIAAKVPLRDFLVVPVPLHRWRLWRRGFNQSALLAQAIGKLRDFDLAVDALVRRKSTPLLGGMGRVARRRALAGAIAVAPSRKLSIAGRDILLVDDVVTSGATSDACVSALRRAGAKSVTIACFARVLDEAIPDVSDQNETPGAEAPGAA